MNPFMLFFLDSVECATDLCEKRFLVELLCSAPSNREVKAIDQKLCHIIKMIIVPNHIESRDFILPGPNLIQL